MNTRSGGGRASGVNGAGVSGADRGQITSVTRRGQPGAGRDLRRAQAQDRQSAIISEATHPESRAGRAARRSSSPPLVNLIRREVPEPLVGPLRVVPPRVPREVGLDPPEGPVEEETAGVLALHAPPEALEERDGAGLPDRAEPSPDAAAGEGASEGARGELPPAVGDDPRGDAGLADRLAKEMHRERCRGLPRDGSDGDDPTGERVDDGADVDRSEQGADAREVEDPDATRAAGEQAAPVRLPVRIPATRREPQLGHSRRRR